MEQPWYSGKPFGVPMTVGPGRFENLPFGIPQVASGIGNFLDSPMGQGVLHPWPFFKPGTDQLSPLGQHNQELGNFIIDGLGASVGALTDYTGLTSPKPKTPVAPPAAPAPQSVAPQSGIDYAAALGGGGSGMSFSQPLPPRFEPPAPANYDKVRAKMGEAAPTEEKLNEEDRLFYILEGLGKSGALDAQSVGELLFSLGIGGFSGAASARREERALNRDYNKEKRAFALSEAELESNVTSADRQYAADLAKADYDYRARVAETLAPKVSGQYLISSKEDGKNITSTLTPLPDPDFQTKAAMAFSLGGGQQNVAASIIGGQSIPGVAPESMSAIRAKLMEELYAVYQDPKYQESMQAMAMSGGSEKIDPQQLALMMLDQRLMSIDPQRYTQMADYLNQRAAMRGLLGRGKSWD